MTGFKVLALLLLFALAVSLTAKFLLRSINRWEKKKSLKNNPYIQYHKTKNKNDENYQDYLEWMRGAHGVPVDKVVMPEDAKAENKFRQLL